MYVQSHGEDLRKSLGNFFILIIIKMITRSVSVVSIICVVFVILDFSW